MRDVFFDDGRLFKKEVGSKAVLRLGFEELEGEDGFEESEEVLLLREGRDHVAESDELVVLGVPLQPRVHFALVGVHPRVRPVVGSLLDEALGQPESNIIDPIDTPRCYEASSAKALVDPASA